MSNLKEITVNSHKYSIEYFLGRDWKFLACVCCKSNFACIWCKSPRNKRFDISKKWSITDKSFWARDSQEIGKYAKSNECTRSSQLRTLLKRVVENRTWNKFRPIRDLKPWPLWYRCSAQPTELTSQLGAGQYVGSKYTIQVMNNDFRYMKTHIFALWWRNECKRSSQLRTLLERVVENRTNVWIFFNVVQIYEFSYI